MTKEIHVLLRPIRNKYGQTILRYVINRDTLCFPEELENLLRIKRYSQTNLNSFFNQNEKLSVCLLETHMVDIGYYNFDEEDIPDYREESTYIPIQYNPITGEKFEIVIDGLLNRQKEYDDIIQELNDIENLSSRSESQQKKLNQLSNEYNLFYQDLYVCDEKYRDTCEKGHCINCKDVCEDFRRAQLVYLIKDLYEVDVRTEPENSSTKPIKKLLLRGNRIYPLIKRGNGIVEIYSGVDTLKISEKVFFENFMIL